MDSKNYQDHYFKQAKSQGYRSRSALKLIELNNKFKFIKNGINVLDVGSFPGGWCQVIRKKINNGKILGIDIKKNTRNWWSKINSRRFSKRRLKENYKELFYI